MQIYVLISVLANYFHFGNSCLFVQFAFHYIFVRARVRNKPRAFLHFCIFAFFVQEDSLQRKARSFTLSGTL